MRTIVLCGGKNAIVSDQDYEELAAYTWCVKQHTPDLAYVYRYVRQLSGKYRRMKMHNQIVKPLDGLTVDHINGDPLDNRRCNLRLANQRQQAQNMRKRIAASSKFKGVTKCGLVHGKYVSSVPWRARIRVNGKLLSLGFYPTEEEAAIAYNKAASKYFGRFAALNEVQAEA